MHCFHCLTMCAARSSLMYRARRIQSGSQAGASCRCVDANCHYCVRTVNGDTCRVCKSSHYLLNGTCVATCPAGKTSSGTSTYRRRCEDPFTCQSGRITDRAVAFGCACPNVNNTARAPCHICLFRADEHGQHCIKCKSAKFLHENVCRDNCDGIPGVISYIPGNYGRACRPSFLCMNGLDEYGIGCKCSRNLRQAGCNSCIWDVGGDTCLDP